MASTLRPRRSPGLARCRLGMRVAAGLSPAQAARAEGLPGDEIEALLARPDFARLVQDFRDLASLPREERLARLEALAFDVLEDAIGAGDVRVVLWFLSERHAGRDPVRRVAEAVVRHVERAGAAPTPRPASPPVRRPTARHPDPCGRRLAAYGRHARDLVAVEGAARAAATRPAVSPVLLARVARRAGCATAVGRCLGPVAAVSLPPPGSTGGPSRTGGVSPDQLGGPVEPGHGRDQGNVEPAGLSPRWPMVA